VWLGGGGERANERVSLSRPAAGDPRRGERMEMGRAPAPGAEAGAFATTMDIVVG